MISVLSLRQFLFTLKDISDIFFKRAVFIDLFCRESSTEKKMLQTEMAPQQTTKETRIALIVMGKCSIFWAQLLKKVILYCFSYCI